MESFKEKRSDLSCSQVSKAKATVNLVRWEENIGFFTGISMIRHSFHAFQFVNMAKYHIDAIFDIHLHVVKFEPIKSIVLII